MSTGGGAGFSPESVQPEHPEGERTLFNKITNAIAHSTQAKSSQRPIEGYASDATYRPQEGAGTATSLPENTADLIPDGQQHAAPKDAYRYETRPLPQPLEHAPQSATDPATGGGTRRLSGKRAAGARGRASTDVAMESPAAQAMRELRQGMTDDTPKLRKSLDRSVPGFGQ